jgi:gas vesicle protein
MDWMPALYRPQAKGATGTRELRTQRCRDSAHHMNDTRLQALEEMAAELLKTTDDLSDVIARQEREIAVLTHRVQMLL